MGESGLKNLSSDPNEIYDPANPYLEQIFGENERLNESLDTLSQELTISGKKITDFYIAPQWNRTHFRIIPPTDEDLNKLTHIINYTNLDVRLMPSFPWLDLMIESPSFLSSYEKNETDGTISNETSLFEFIFNAFEKTYNFTFEDLNISDNKTYPSFFNKTLPELFPDFVFLVKDSNFDPNEHPWSYHAPNPLKGIMLYFQKLQEIIQTQLWAIFHPFCRAILKYNFDNQTQTYNMQYCPQIRIPVININHSIGQPLYNELCNETLDNESLPDRVNFSINQIYHNVTSYNVIGEIPGKDPTKTILVSCLYDGWWNQATGDAAIGIGIVLALARYYQELNTTYHIKPKYTIKFVGFSGEEWGVRGATYYYKTHCDNENIIAMIDLNQLGFSQTGKNPQTFFIVTNNKTTQKIIQNAVSGTNYTKRSGTPYLKFLHMTDGGPSDSSVFAKITNTILFVKDVNWTLHHRDGLSHTQGDTMQYYNDTDVAATADMIFNCSKYFLLNPNCTFTEIDDKPWLKNPPAGHTLPNSIQVNYTITTTLPQDRVWVKAFLVAENHNILGRYSNETHYVVTPAGITGNIAVTLPPRAPDDYYTLHVYLYNSTGEINRKTTYILRWKETGQFSNSTQNYAEKYHMRPNDPPNAPLTPWGETEARTGIPYIYTTNTTAANNSTIWYQWRYQTRALGDMVTFYSRWIHGGQSGENSSKVLLWTTSGNYNISVRAKNNIFNPNVYSAWSPNLTINVSDLLGGNPAWNNEFLNGFSLTTLSVNQETGCGGLAQGMSMGENSNAIVNWTWNYGDGNISYGPNATHSYSEIGNYTIRLTIRDDLNNYFNCSQNITVLILNAGFRTTGDWQPEKQVRFNDTSAGLYPIVNWTWDFGDGNTSYTPNATHNYSAVGCYNVTLTVRDNQNDTHATEQPVEVELTPPELAQVVNYPDPAISGTPVTIEVDLLDNQSGIKEVKVNITTPNNTSINSTMAMTNLTEYDYTYTFDDTWQPGVYNYSIWVEDNANNTNDTTGFNFTILRTPIIDFEPPTPNNASIVNHSWTQINTTVQDNHITSAFINWNHSLKGYWPMDFYNTTGVFDNSTYHNFGKFEGGMTTGNIHNGKYGKAVEFDGTNDDLDLGANNSLHLGTGNFTFIVWENSDQNSYAHKAILLTNRPADANVKGYIFGVQNTANLYVTQASGNNVTLNGHIDVTDHTWHHIAYVRRGTNYSIYVDGAYDAGITGEMKNITNTQHTSLAYGHWSNCAYFDGLLDEPQL